MPLSFNAFLQQLVEGSYCGSESDYREAGLIILEQRLALVRS